MKTIPILAVATFVAAGPVMAQPLACDCTTQLPQGAVAGELTRMTGRVLISTTSGLAPAQQGSSLVVGSQMITGPASSAELGLGDCSMSVVANSEVSILVSSGQMCVRVSEVPTTASVPPGFLQNWGPFIAFSALEAGLTYHFVTVDGGNKKMSDE
jgi:hypothetical protein